MAEFGRKEETRAEVEWRLWTDYGCQRTVKPEPRLPGGELPEL